MQTAPCESCEHCNRLLIHPVVTTCPRGRKAALRAIDGVRTLGREVAAEWASTDAAHSVAFKKEADAKAKAKKEANAKARARRKERKIRHLPATAGRKLLEQEITEQPVFRQRARKRWALRLLWNRRDTFLWETTALEAGLGLYGPYRARPATALEVWLGLDYGARPEHLPTCLFCSQPKVYKNGRCFHHATKTWRQSKATRVATLDEVQAALSGLSLEETKKLKSYAIKMGDSELYYEAWNKILDGPILPPGKGRKWKPERVGLYTLYSGTIKSLADNKKRAERVRAGMKGRENGGDKERPLTAKQAELREAANRIRAEGAARRAADPALAGIDKELAGAAERRLQEERGPQIFNVFARRWTPAESRELGWGNFAERRPIPYVESIPDRPARSAFRDQDLSHQSAVLGQDRESVEMLEGLVYGLSAEDIRQKRGLTDREYSTIRRRLLRKTRESWSGPGEEDTPSAAEEDEAEPGEEGWSNRMLNRIGDEQRSGSLEEEYPA